MKALVVYESMWGNTREVAQAVADGIGGARLAHVSEVAADDVGGVDLLVVGGPTHAFSMSRPTTRQDAVERGAPAAANEHQGIREWLRGLPPTLTVPVATFDTKVTTVRHLPGSAAKGASTELKRRHRARVLDHRSFYVEDMAGPLADGELVRARSWGSQLALRALPSAG